MFFYSPVQPCVFFNFFIWILSFRTDSGLCPIDGVSGLLTGVTNGSREHIDNLNKSLFFVGITYT